MVEDDSRRHTMAVEAQSGEAVDGDPHMALDEDSREAVDGDPRMAVDELSRKSMAHPLPDEDRSTTRNIEKVRDSYKGVIEQVLDGSVHM